MPTNASVKQVFSWREALDGLRSRKWESFQLQMKNVLVEQVNRANYERFTEWNHNVGQINKALEGVLAGPIQEYVEKNDLGVAITDDLRWNLLHICCESEYDDVVKPLYFLDNVWPWYQSGHFPCGWDGVELTEHFDGENLVGRLIIF